MARPREFEIDEALDSAMQAFWERGYEATSMQDLLDAMNLTKGSLYKAFGDKHSLFLQALQKYLDFIYGAMSEAIHSDPDPAVGVEHLMLGVEKLCCKQEVRRGCFAVNSVVELGHQDPDAALLLQKHLQRVEKLLAGVIRTGQENGQFRTDKSAAHLAEGLFVVIMGMLAQSKGTANLQRAKRISNFALSALRSTGQQ